MAGAIKCLFVSMVHSKTEWISISARVSITDPQDFHSRNSSLRSDHSNNFYSVDPTRHMKIVGLWILNGHALEAKDKRPQIKYKV